MSVFLKEVRESEFRMSRGREFQRIGAAVSKALYPQSVVLGLDDEGQKVGISRLEVAGGGMMVEEIR